MSYFNKNVGEGLFNPKTVGTDMRVTHGLSTVGQQYGLGAVDAQRQALAGYQGIASGTAPSLAQMQMRAGIEANNRAAFGLMGQARGGNVAGAYQTALGAQQGANIGAAQAGGLLRAQEQQMAYGNMVQLAGQMAGQQFGYDQLNQQSLLGLRGQDLNYNLGKRGLDMQADQQAFSNAMAVGTAGASAVGSMLGGIGAMGAGFGDPPEQTTSDNRAKVGLGALPMGGAGEAVAQIQPVAWDGYTDPSMGQGPRIGVSAQQLQGTSLGGLVQPGPDGMLRVDGAAAGTTALAASADQEHRIRELEARLAQVDPYASEQMRTMGQEFERAREGPYRTTLERRRMAHNEREAQRGLGLVRGATPRSQFEGSPQMSRAQATSAADPQFDAIMRAPGTFSSPEFMDSPSPFGPDPVEREGLSPRAGLMRPRRRRPGLVQVTDAPGQPMRAAPVSFGNTPMRMTARAGEIRQPDVGLYRGDVIDPSLSGELGMGPAEAEAYDAQLDYLDDWTAVDETGRRTLLPMPRSESLGFAPPNRQGDRLSGLVEDADRAALFAESPMGDHAIDEFGNPVPMRRGLRRGLGAIRQQTGGMSAQQAQDARVLQMLINDQRERATALPVRRAI
jgi:hypothetical protein